MLTEIQKITYDLRHNFNRDRKYEKSNIELNTIEIKNTVEGMNRRLLKVQERICVMEDRE